MIMGSIAEDLRDEGLPPQMEMMTIAEANALSQKKEKEWLKMKESNPDGFGVILRPAYSGG